MVEPESSEDEREVAKVGITLVTMILAVVVIATIVVVIVWAF